MGNCGGDLLRSIIKNSDDYDEEYIKIKFNSGQVTCK